MFYYDKYFIILVLPFILFSIYVQIKMQMVYSKFSKINNFRNLTGAVVARNILNEVGLAFVKVECVEGSLTDCFDPRQNVVRLSHKNYYGNSIAAVGVSAHEVGHAIQFARAYVPAMIRTRVVVVTRFGSFLWWPVIFLGLIFSIYRLILLGICLFSIVVFFELITLPVEFDASFRAFKILKSNEILSSHELHGVKKVLWAAAMTYVASFLVTLMQLLRFVLIFLSNRNDND